MFSVVHVYILVTYLYFKLSTAVNILITKKKNSIQFLIHIFRASYLKKSSGTIRKFV